MIYALGAVFLCLVGVLVCGLLDRHLKYGSCFSWLCAMFAWGFAASCVWVFFFIWDIVFFVLLLLFLAGVCYTLVESISYVWSKIFP